MKILGKNVVIGTKKICMEYTYKINTAVSGGLTESTEFIGDSLEENVVFIRDKKGSLVEAKDLDSFPTLSLICYGAATRWKTTPVRTGDTYVDNIKPYFNKTHQEHLYELKELISIIKNKNLHSTKEDSIPLVENSVL